MPPKRDTPQEKKTYTDWKWRVGKKMLQLNWQKEKAGVAIFISDKIDFKTKTIKRDTEGQFILLKERIHQENINIVNICTQHRSTQTYKENLGGLQDIDRQQHTYTTGF